jgi:hypothetical protein
MKALYRDDELGVRLHYEDLLQQRERAIDHLSGPVARIYERRLGRAAAGAVGVAGAAALAASSLTVFVIDEPKDGALTQILFGSWLVAGAAYLAGRLIAKHRIRSALQRMARPSGDLRADVERLREAEPARALRRLTDGLERSSVALPLMMVALLMPLTLQAIVSKPLFSWKGDDFDGWILMSLAIVGHCHLVLAYLGWRFARTMRSWSTQVLVGKRHREGWVAWGITTAVSFVPGIILLAIPPILVAVTGLFVPIVFYAMTVRVAAERGTLEAHA